QRHKGDFSGDKTRVIVLAELNDGCDKALAEYREIFRDIPLSGVQENHFILLLLGKTDLARKEFKNFVLAPGLKSEKSKDFNEARRRFGLDEIKKDKYLEKAGFSRHWQLVAHLDIGLFCLAGGDFEGARYHFNEGVKTKTYWFQESFFCQTFVSRLDSGENWPRCIAKPKQNEAKPKRE